MTTYDYIIVGAGAAGCVLASRLTDDPSVQVLLIEYGGRDLNPLLYVPKGFYFTLQGDRYTYNYPTQPVGPSQQPESWTRGKVSGGSTTINGMMYVRGAAADYDDIVERGNRGWGWSEMLPIFRAMEDHALGPSSTRGAGGPLGVTVSGQDDAVSEAIVLSAEKMGLRRSADYNDGDDERIGFTPSTIKNGVRTSAASAFLRPARKRPNLTVVLRTRVGYLRFDGNRVVGVRAKRSGSASYEDFGARREVIVSAGTVETTLLLERSGIGQPEALTSAGVSVRVESPNLGERVTEQRGVCLQVKLKGKLGLTHQLNTMPKQGLQALRYAITRSGPIATGGYDLTCAFKSSPMAERPDVQGIWMPLALDTGSDKMKLAEYAGATFVGWQIRPTTRSSIHIGSALPESAPLISPRFLETELDREATAPILPWAREMVANGPLSDMVDSEVVPGPSVSTAAEVVRFAVDTPLGIYHAVGSAAMGPNDDDVVDDRLRVRGVEGLRVIDASVFAEQPAGNTAAPTMAVAWRAADLIRQEL